jgi:protein gp37
MEDSKISWCTHTFNPWIGCVKVSDGCKNCYACELVTKRMGRPLWGPNSKRQITKTWADPAKWQEAASAERTLVGLSETTRCRRRLTALRRRILQEFLTLQGPVSIAALAAAASCRTRDVRELLDHDYLAEVGRRSLDELARPRVFCASLADVFEDHPDLVDVRPKLWDLIRDCGDLDWLLLTKRPENIRGMMPSDWGAGGWPHVWVGTSIEDMRVAGRADALRQVPAVCRFISYEPALGPLDELDLTGIDWVIYGGESGKGWRPANPDWARAMRDKCAAEGVSFFHKQSAAPRPGCGVELDGAMHHEWPAVKLVQLGLPPKAA